MSELQENDTQPLSTKDVEVLFDDRVSYSEPPIKRQHRFKCCGVDVSFLKTIAKQLASKNHLFFHVMSSTLASGVGVGYCFLAPPNQIFSNSRINEILGACVANFAFNSMFAVRMLYDRFQGPLLSYNGKYYILFQSLSCFILGLASLFCREPILNAASALAWRIGLWSDSAVIFLFVLVSYTCISTSQNKQKLGNNTN